MSNNTLNISKNKKNILISNKFLSSNDKMTLGKVLGDDLRPSTTPTDEKKKSDESSNKSDKNRLCTEEKRRSEDNTLLYLDYDSTHSKISSSQVSEISINSNLSGYQCVGDPIKEQFNSLGKRLHNIESLLWDNRDKYTTSLDIVANREIEICRALDETKKLLRENRELYTHAFQRLFSKEEILENMLKETKEILTENRKILVNGMTDLQKKNSESLLKMDGMTDLQRKNSESLEKIEKIKEFKEFKEFNDVGILLTSPKNTNINTPLISRTSHNSPNESDKGMIL